MSGTMATPALLTSTAVMKIVKRTQFRTPQA
jgi:hypothetical protein